MLVLEGPFFVPRTLDLLISQWLPDLAVLFEVEVKLRHCFTGALQIRHRRFVLRGYIFRICKISWRNTTDV